MYFNELLVKSYVETDTNVVTAVFNVQYSIDAMVMNERETRTILERIRPNILPSQGLIKGNKRSLNSLKDGDESQDYNQTVYD